MPRRKAPLAQPALLEWNFAGCPADELSTCHYYEYTRSSSLLRETVKRKREGGEDPLTGALFLVFPFTAIWIIEGPHSHWWPLAPYLEIPLAERRSHLLRELKDRDLAEGCNPWTHLDDIERFVVIYAPRGWPLSMLKQGVAQLIAPFTPSKPCPKVKVD